MYCKKCGTETEDDAKFSVRCGAIIVMGEEQKNTMKKERFMKTKDIASKYGFKQYELDRFIKESGYKYKTTTLGGLIIDDNEDISRIVKEFEVTIQLR